MPRMFKCIFCGGEGKICKKTLLRFDECGCDGTDGEKDCAVCLGTGKYSLGGSNVTSAR